MGSVATYSPTIMDWQNSVEFQSKVRWHGRTIVAYSGINAGEAEDAGAETVNVKIIVKIADGGLREGPPTSDAGEPPPHSDADEAGRKTYFSQVRTCSERVIQMGRWELQVVKNVRGSGPPLFSTASTVSTAGRRGSATSGRRRWTEEC